MQINKDLPTPLYYQVKDYLEDKIISGEWEQGYQIPTEKELANQFEVSMITVKRAVHDLVNKEMLFRQRGKGTFVNKKADKDLYELVTLKNEAEDSTQHPHKNIKFEDGLVGDELAKLMGIQTNDRIFKIHRLKMEEDVPIGIEYSHIPAVCCPDLTYAMLENDLIYNVFTKKYNIELGKAKIYFSTAIAKEYEAHLLKVEEGEQLFVIERFTYTLNKRIVEYSKFIMRQDKANYFIEVGI